MKQTDRPHQQWRNYEVGTLTQISKYSPPS